MPMDENEKKELVKKIMEQRKAVWDGKSISDYQKKQPKTKPEKSTLVPPNPPDSAELRNGRTEAKNVKTLSPESYDTIDNSIPVDFEIPEKRGLWEKITDEFRRSGELGWKVFFIMVALIGAIMFGVLIGYLASTTGLMSKLKL